MRKHSIIGGTIGLLAGVPLLASAVGWSITLVLMAVIVVLAVRVWKKVQE